MTSSDNEKSIDTKRSSSIHVDSKINELIYHIVHNHVTKKPKLILARMNLTLKDIRLDLLLDDVLSEHLYKLSLSRNPLGGISPEIVQGGLRSLQTLNLQQCGLVELPDAWNLPMLRRLDLSHNKLSEIKEVGTSELWTESIRA